MSRACGFAQPPLSMLLLLAYCAAGVDISASSPAAAPMHGGEHEPLDEPMAPLLKLVRVKVTSDGTLLKPHCSYGEVCRWDSANKNMCADELCKAGGYAGGTFVSASNNMCESDFASEEIYHVLTNGRHKPKGGRSWQAMDPVQRGNPSHDAQITAMCEKQSDEGTDEEPGEGAGGPILAAARDADGEDAPMDSTTQGMRMTPQPHNGYACRAVGIGARTLGSVGFRTRS